MVCHLPHRTERTIAELDDMLMPQMQVGSIIVSDSPNKLKKETVIQSQSRIGSINIKLAFLIEFFCFFNTPIIHGRKHIQNHVFRTIVQKSSFNKRLGRPYTLFRLSFLKACCTLLIQLAKHGHILRLLCRIVSYHLYTVFQRSGIFIIRLSIPEVCDKSVQIHRYFTISPCDIQEYSVRFITHKNRSFDASFLVSHCRLL